MRLQVILFLLLLLPLSCLGQETFFEFQSYEPEVKIEIQKSSTNLYVDIVNLDYNQDVICTKELCYTLDYYNALALYGHDEHGYRIVILISTKEIMWMVNKESFTFVKIKYE